MNNVKIAGRVNYGLASRHRWGVVPVEKQIVLRGNAIEAETEDQFSRGKYVSGLVDVIISANISTGITLGLVGKWGEGKTSVLNLLQKRISEEYPDAVIVSFNPWLIANRDDLIAAFFKALIHRVRDKHEHAVHSFRSSQIAAELSKLFAQYGSSLTPLLNHFHPGAGLIGKIVIKIVSTVMEAFSAPKEPEKLKEKIENLLSELNVPIVVLIDEVDRVEDDDVRCLAQLVRAIANFRAISYVLAYDDLRVAEALGGSGKSRFEKLTRGRKYLEKIVQVPLQLPIIFPGELIALLDDGVRGAARRVGIDTDRATDGRYREIAAELVPEKFSTARDIRRLLSNFSVRLNYVAGEVDPTDVLAFTALQIIAPEISEYIRRWPERFVVDGQDPTFSLGLSKKTYEDLFKSFAPANEATEYNQKFLTRIFPAISKSFISRTDNPDRIAFRRPLLTLLRMSLLPGAISRREMAEIISAPDVKLKLAELLERRELRDFITRLSEIYPDLNVPHSDLWGAIAECIDDMPVGSWLERYEKKTLIRSVTNDLANLIRRFDEVGNEVLIGTIRNLISHGQLIFAANVLRQVFHQKYSPKISYVERLMTDVASAIRALNRNSPLDHQMVFLLNDLHMWTEEDKIRESENILSSDASFDQFMFESFGGSYVMDKSGVELFLSFDDFSEYLQHRMHSESFRRVPDELLGAYKAAVDFLGIEVSEGSDALSPREDV